MNNVKLCLCFVLVALPVCLIECRGGHGGHGSHGSHSSHGHSSYGHSSHSSHGSHGGGWFSGWFSGGSRSTGSSSSHTYPHSTGYSGHGSGGSHTYPSSHGMSGSGGSHWSSSHYGPSRPTYYTAPQYVYVTRYRETQSPYSDLLTGLTMYNLGRSHHYHHHYYNDDYQRSSSSGGNYNHHTNTGSEWQNSNTNGSIDEGKCVLKVKKDEKLEVLSIPCAIVSTFDNGTHTPYDAAQDRSQNNCTSAGNMNMTLDDNSNVVNNNSNLQLSNSSSIDNSTSTNTTSTNTTVINPCLNQTVDIKDPLSVTGAPIPSSETANMECSVEIRTKQEVIQNSVDCSTLLKYAKMAVPADKTTNILPSRETLKSLLNKPPWWMSLFIAV